MNMSVLRNQLDYTKSTNDSYRVKECPLCEGTGTSDAVQVTRKSDGFLCYCFRCLKSWWFPDVGASPREAQQVLANAGREKKDTRPTMVSLPNDYTTDLPAKAAVQLYDNRITDEDIKFFDIGWSQGHNRIIFPIYKYLQSESEETAKKLVGILGRKLADDTSDKPKWWSVRQRDIKHPRFVGLPRKITHHKSVVVVEDIPSAIRVAQTGRFSLALLTTYLPYELYPILRGWNVYLWLDADAYTKSLKYQGKMGANGISANVVFTAEDPKAYTKIQIEEAITNGKLI